MDEKPTCEGYGPAPSIGDRVRLIRTTDDPPTRLRPGDEGVVVSVGGHGLDALVVDWDHGFRAGLRFGDHHWETIEPPEL